MAYPKVMADRYDSDWDAIAMPRRDAAFYFDLAAQSAGPVCEVGAGTGRCLLPIARVFDRPVHGVEPSEHMLAHFAAHVAAEPEAVRRRVSLHHGDFSALPLPDASQHLVFSAFRSFQHVLTVADQLAALAEVRRVLAPGGTMAIDLFEPAPDLLADSEPELMTEYAVPARQSVVQRFDWRRHDRAAQRFEVFFRWLEVGADGGVLRDDTSSYQVRYTYRYELVHLLARAGFDDYELLGDFDGSPLDDTPRQLIVVARAG